LLLATASGEDFHPVGYEADCCIEISMSEELLLLLLPLLV